jgi:hypothetical protein
MHFAGVLTIDSSWTLKLVLTRTGRPVLRSNALRITPGFEHAIPEDVARYRHIAAGAPIDIRDIEDLASFFALDYWYERHEIHRPA